MLRSIQLAGGLDGVPFQDLEFEPNMNRESVFWFIEALSGIEIPRGEPGDYVDFMISGGAAWWARRLPRNW